MKMKLECQECDKVFSRSANSVYPKCPRCDSEDLYSIGWVRPKTVMARNTGRDPRFVKSRPQRYSDYF
jgi:phage FluMu protein Com